MSLSRKSSGKYIRRKFRDGRKHLSCCRNVQNIRTNIGQGVVGSNETKDTLFLVYSNTFIKSRRAGLLQTNKKKIERFRITYLFYA